MEFTLIDDGTMDTVVQCDKCGNAERFDSAALIGTMTDGDSIESILSHLPSDIAELNERRVATAIEWAEQDHECN